MGATERHPKVTAHHHLWRHFGQGQGRPRRMRLGRLAPGPSPLLAFPAVLFCLFMPGTPRPVPFEKAAVAY
jgi:hypothetical protein